MDGAIKGRKWARSVLMQSNQLATSTANRYNQAGAKQEHIRSPQRLQLLHARHVVVLRGTAAHEPDSGEIIIS